MKSIQTVTVVGLGALGILFADQLSRALPKSDLRILADKARIARYRREGVFCNGHPCDFQYVAPSDPCAPADLLLFTVKQGGLKAAIDIAAAHVGPDTILLSALNGISSEREIAERYGKERVLYCVAQGMDAVKKGNRLTYAHPGLLCFGEETPGVVSERMQKVSDFFRSVGIAHEAVEDMLHRQWGKLMLNVGVNQTVAVFRGNYGTIQVPGEARELMIAAMREVMALAPYEGIRLTEEDLSYWLSLLDTLAPEGKPSMAQDIEAGRDTEVELFSGTVCRLSQLHGLHAPINERLYRAIREMEKTK